MIGSMTETKTKKPRHRSRTYQRNRQKKIKQRLVEPDGIYFLKLVVLLLVSTVWLQLATPVSWQGVPLGAFPVGAIAALIAVRLIEKDPYDRKIWFVVVLFAVIVSFFKPTGIII
jgi:hypothetical protein